MTIERILNFKTNNPKRIRKVTLSFQMEHLDGHWGEHLDRIYLASWQTDLLHRQQQPNNRRM